MNAITSTPRTGYAGFVIDGRMSGNHIANERAQFPVATLRGIRECIEAGESTSTKPQEITYYHQHILIDDKPFYFWSTNSAADASYVLEQLVKLAEKSCT